MNDKLVTKIVLSLERRSMPLPIEKNIYICIYIYTFSVRYKDILVSIVRLQDIQGLAVPEHYQRL